MPPIVLGIISILSLVTQATPAAQKIYEEGRKLIDMLFRGGLITVAQQDSLKSWADDHEKATLAGVVPPEFQVEPDPE